MPITGSTSTARVDPAAVKTRLRMKHLQLFRSVCELHSLRKAAAATNMTQPAATKLVQELETMFRARLFERDRSGMRLTAHGELARRHFDVVMADVGNLCDELDLFASGGTGVVRLGIIPSLSSVLLAESIDQLLAAHPQVHLEIQEAVTNELMRELAQNNLDIIFGRVLQTGHASNLRVMDVYTECFDIVCGRHHPFAGRRSPGWKELARQRWVLPAHGSPLRDMTENLFTGRGALRPVVAVATSSFQQIRHIVGRGRLLGVLPRSVSAQGQADGDVVLLRPIPGTNFAPISLIARKDFEQPPSVQAFERIVMRTAAALKLA